MFTVSWRCFSWVVWFHLKAPNALELLLCGVKTGCSPYLLVQLMVCLFKVKRMVWIIGRVPYHEQGDILTRSAPNSWPWLKSALNYLVSFVVWVLGEIWECTAGQGSCSSGDQRLQYCNNTIRVEKHTATLSKGPQKQHLVVFLQLPEMDLYLKDQRMCFCLSFWNKQI